MLPKTVEAAAIKLLIDDNRHKLIVLGSGSYAKAYTHADYPEYVIKVSRGEGRESSRDFFAGYYFGKYCMNNPSDILPVTYLAKRHQQRWVLVQKRYLQVSGSDLNSLMDDVWEDRGICLDQFRNIFPKADVKAFESVVREWYCWYCLGGYDAKETLFREELQQKFGTHAELARAGMYVNKHVQRESNCMEKIEADLSASNIMYDDDTKGLVYVDPFCVF